MAGLEIRDYNRELENEVRKIIRSSFGRVYRHFALSSLVECDAVLVGIIDDRAFGVVELKGIDIGERIGNILFIAVHPDFRGRGLGRALLKHAMGRLAELGATIAIASIPRRNDTSMNLFLGEGFRVIKFGEMWRRWRWRFFSIYRRMYIAPHEIVVTKDLL